MILSYCSDFGILWQHSRLWYTLVNLTTDYPGDWRLWFILMTLAYFADFGVFWWLWRTLMNCKYFGLLWQLWRSLNHTIGILWWLMTLAQSYDIGTWFDDFGVVWRLLFYPSSLAHCALPCSLVARHGRTPVFLSCIVQVIIFLLPAGQTCKLSPKWSCSFKQIINQSSRLFLST